MNFLITQKNKPGSLSRAERGSLIVGTLFDAAIPIQKYGRYRRIS